MEVALLPSGFGPDIAAHRMDYGNVQMHFPDPGPHATSLGQEAREHGKNDHPSTQEALLQQSPDHGESPNRQTELPPKPMQETSHLLLPADDESIPMTDPIHTIAQDMQLVDGHGITEETLHQANLAMQLPLQEDIAPEALHSNLGHGMVMEGISNISPIDMSAMGTADEMDLTAYAKLEFPDTTYLVRTLSVELGRDNAAARRAARVAAETGSESESQSRQSSAGEAARTPMRRGSRATGGCHEFSEEGGIMRWNESSSDSNQRIRHKKSKKPKSAKPWQPPALSESQYEAAVAAAAIDDQRHAYPPYDACPLLPIHVPDSFGTEWYKSISRRHARVEYNSDKEVFELHAISRNGIFLNSVHYAAGSSIPLRHRDVIQVGPVPITFTLPSNVVEAQREGSGGESDEGEEGVANAGGQSSLDELDSAESSNEELINTIESEEQASEEEQPQPRQRTKLKLKALPARQKPKASPINKKKEPKLTVTQKEAKQAKNPRSEKSADVRRERKAEKEPSSSAAAETSPGQQNGLPDLLPGSEIPQKRKGPGRPPKDGIMSKRERQARVRQAKEAEKARKLGLPPPPPLDLKTKTEKKRLRKEEEEAAAATGARPTTADTEKTSPDKPTPVATSSTDQANPNEQPKVAKPPKPPARTPSPELKESDFTEEQLARPSANYITLIHEAITNSKNGQMNLQQIYSAIERKYPFYKFRVGTNGWQSSVRHNLGQNDMFQKVEKEGKGYLWAVKEGATPENQKRKRASPPPVSQHPYYPPGQYAGMHGGPNQPRPGMPPYSQYPQRPSYLSHPPTAAPAVVAPPAQNSGNYSSPYASNPPVSAPRPPPAPSNLQNGVSYGQTQHSGSNLPVPSRSASSISQPSSQNQPPSSHTPNPSLTTLLGADYPRHLPISLPGGAKVLTIDMISRLQKFKDVFVEVSTGDKRHSDFLVSQAVKRIFYPGLVQTPFAAGEEDIVKTLSNLIDPTQEKKTLVAATVAAPSSSATTAAAPAAVASPVTHAQRAAVVVVANADDAAPSVGSQTTSATPPSAPAAAAAAMPTAAVTAAPAPSAEDSAAGAPTPAQPPQPGRPVSSASASTPATPQPPAVEPLTPTAAAGSNGSRAASGAIDGGAAGASREASKRDHETDAEASAAEGERRVERKRVRVEEGEEEG
ncbi:MAG: hypothetical protein M1822_000551 [Bathelium mastoideum]|nr:MAG: hypothetical protein M1822_000551 [Bathelium mastoideum]